MAMPGIQSAGFIDDVGLSAVPDDSVAMVSESQGMVGEDSSVFVGWEVMARFLATGGTSLWRYGKVVGVAQQAGVNALVVFGDVLITKRVGASDNTIRGPLDSAPTPVMLSRESYYDGSNRASSQFSWFRMSTKKDADKANAAAYASSLTKFKDSAENGPLCHVPERGQGNCFFLVAARGRKLNNGESLPHTMEAVDQPAIIHAERRAIASAIRANLPTILMAATPFSAGAEATAQIRDEVVRHASQIEEYTPLAFALRHTWGGGTGTSDLIACAMLNKARSMIIYVCWLSCSCTKFSGASLHDYHW